MKRILLSLLLFYIIYGCANIQAPPGGPGDTTAPYIMITEPINNTLNFSEKEVEIKFDGYMNRSSVLENIQITPDVERDYDWSGTDLEISFTEDLQKNTTYAIYLGGTYTDLNGNNPDRSYSLVFSTGNKLDSGKIAGKLYGPEVKGRYIFLYNISDNDFPNPSEVQPDYIVQTGNTGTYEIVALKNGKYRIFALDDKFKNKLYDRNQDAFGTYIKDIFISDSLKEIKNIDIYLREPLDEISPTLVSAQAINSKVIQFEFSENIDISTLNKENLRLIDTTGNEFEISKITREEKKASEFSLIISDNVEKPLKAELVADNIADSTGNVITDTTNSTILYLDTLRIDEELKFSVLNIKDSLVDVRPLQRTISEKPIYYFKLSNITNINYSEYSGYLKSESDSVRLKLYSSDLLNYYLLFDGLLLENTEYTGSISFEGIKDLWGNSLKDTTISFSFVTGFSPKTSKLSGQLISEYDCEGNTILKIVSVDKNFEKQINIDNEGIWEVDSIPAGKYIYEVFCDINNDGEYSFGNINPFEFREVYMKTKEYQIQGNWEYKDVIIRFNE